MSDYSIVALEPGTWDLFADLVERQGGLFGGCWCRWFHDGGSSVQGIEDSRAFKRRMVDEGIAHAALVVIDGRAVAWAEYGTPEELPAIHHRKEYDATQVEPVDYRVTCIQVDKTLRRQGLAAVALQGAVDLVAAAGGGVVEGYPHDLAEKKAQGKKVSSSFLYNGTRTMYERLGFTYDRPKGQGNCVMRKVVEPA
ncbi:GNAT family N-acetyltransferase [Nocardioides sp.]|uniref:GNAT family N-acetyltransferase n=1 Tax=Nocardioides sp. TaxID=35761 RepID=UPI002727DC65|nr:GNAT family N-acetyltransferase [Nocardioides sp.]MDO9457647.1 GNAT family N-acetyltransferase [Nocardioides sp.]